MSLSIVLFHNFGCSMVHCPESTLEYLQISYIMKQLIKVQETKEFYRTPAVEFLNLESEGIICASVDGIIEDWEEDDDPITI